MLRELIQQQQQHQQKQQQQQQHLHCHILHRLCHMSNTVIRHYFSFSVLSLVFVSLARAGPEAGSVHSQKRILE